MSQELMRIVDSICRDKNIDRYTFLADLEGAMVSAVRKAYGTEEADVKIDQISGTIEANVEGRAITMQELGRIAAQTAKQVIIQRTRERERESIYEEFSDRVHTIVTGQVVREERGNLLVNIGRTEGFLPRSEQIPGETHQVGDRIRALILEVREQGNQVKIILSRSHPELIVRLFELEVPEVAERIIEIKALAREAGYRSKVAVASIDAKVDAVGACVGVRGSRIKNIVDELSNEKIDIVRWNESSQILIQNALKPAEVQDIALCLELGKATVVVQDDQLSLAIGKRGQNVRLASRLTKWDVDILTPEEYNKNLEAVERILKQVDGVDDVLLDKLVVMGLISTNDIDEVGPETLVENLDLDPDLAEKICYEAGEEVIRLEEEREAAEKAKAEAERLGITPPEDAAPSAFVAESRHDDSPPAAGGAATTESAPAAPETAPTDPAEATPSPAADSTAAATELSDELAPEDPTPPAEAPSEELPVDSDAGTAADVLESAIAVPPSDELPAVTDTAPLSDELPAATDAAPPVMPTNDSESPTLADLTPPDTQSVAPSEAKTSAPSPSAPAASDDTGPGNKIEDAGNEIEDDGTAAASEPKQPASGGPSGSDPANEDTSAPQPAADETRPAE